MSFDAGAGFKTKEIALISSWHRKSVNWARRDLAPREGSRIYRSLPAGSDTAQGLLVTLERMGEQPPSQPLLDSLSERELEVLKQVPEGTTKREIGTTLCVTKSMV